MLVFLIQDYKQTFSQEVLKCRVVKHAHTDTSLAMVRGELDTEDWNMFLESSADVNEFTEAIIIFISMLAEEAAHTVTIKTFPKLKPMGG